MAAAGFDFGASHIGVPQCATSLTAQAPLLWRPPDNTPRYCITPCLTASSASVLIGYAINAFQTRFPKTYELPHRESQPSVHPQRPRYNPTCETKLVPIGEENTVAGPILWRHLGMWSPASVRQKTE